MAIKSRKSTALAADRLADELADKPYGSDGNKAEKLVRTSLSLPADMHEQLEDIATANKRAGRDLRTVSAIVRVAIEKYIINNK